MTMHAKLLALAALAACADPRAAVASHPEPARAGPYALELLDAAGHPLPTFEHRGRTYVMGVLGERYALRVRNGSDRRVEVVASVDGRDVIDGRPATREKRGYVVDPHGEVLVDGFRLSGESVAAFRFSSVPRSYAARMGDARDVGVVGVALFAERERPRPPPPPYRSPWDSGSSDGSRGAATPPSAAPESEAAAGSRPDAKAARRPGLGTEFGEERRSEAYAVTFERASARPEASLTLRYDDRDGLLAAGVDVDRHRLDDEAWTRRTAEPFRRDPPFSEPPPGWRRW
jgi:hypothetical protein